MNGNQSTQWARAKRIGIWIGLALSAAGCADWARSSVDSAIVEIPDEQGPRGEPVATIHEPYRIELTGSNNRWHVRYADGEGRFADEGAGPIVRDVHVPVQTDVVLLLKSEDYVYTLALPQFGLKEIAVPTLEFRMEFRPPDAGRFLLLGDQLCGDPHPDLQCGLVVEPRDHFMEWLKNR